MGRAKYVILILAQALCEKMTVAKPHWAGTLRHLR